jgi:hypothetical protein
MPWEDLNKNQQKFIYSYFEKRGLFSGKRHKSKANMALIEGYELYLSLSKEVENALATLKGGQGHYIYEFRAQQIQSETSSKGDFIQSAKVLTTLLAHIHAQLRDNKLSESEKGQKTKARERLQGKLENRALEASGEFERTLGELMKLASDQGIAAAQGLGEDAKDAIQGKYNDAMEKASQEISALELNGVGSADAVIAQMQKVYDDFLVTGETLLIESRGVKNSAIELFASLEKKPEFLRLSADCRLRLAELERWGYPGADARQKEHFQISSTAFSSVDYATGITALADWRKQVDAEHKSIADAFDLEATKHQNTLLKIENSLAGIDKSVPPKQREQLQDLIDIAKQNLLGGKNIGALAPMEAFLARANTLLGELAHFEVINTTTRRCIDAISEVLGKAGGSDHKLNSETRPVEFSQLKSEFKALHDSWLSLSPDKAASAFEDLKKRCDTFAKTVTDQVAWRKIASKRADELEKKVNDLSKAIFDFGKDDHGKFATFMREKFGMGGDKYEGSMREDLTTARGWISTEDISYQRPADKKLDQLQTKIINWLGSADKLRAAADAGQAPTSGDMSAVMGMLNDHKAGVEAREAKERRLEHYTQASKLADKMLEKLISDSQDKAKIQEYKSILDYNKTGIPQAKAGEFEAAEAILSRVKFRLDEELKIKERAQDSFENLGNIPGNWLRQVENFTTKFEELKTKVNSAAGELPSDELTKLNKGLAAMVLISGKLEKSAFDAPMEVLKVSGNDAALRKRNREQALKTVRLYRDFLKNNEGVKRAATNPFSVNGIATPVVQALNSIEYDVLISI